MKNLILIFALLVTTLSFGQEVKIQTSAECGDCKVRIEDGLNYTKGVKYAELDLGTKIVTVGFNPKKITEAEIKKVISEIGYDADDVKANPASIQELPMCCRPKGMEDKK